MYEAFCAFVHQIVPKDKLDSRVSFEKVYRASSAVSIICHFSCHLNKDQCAICLKKEFDGNCEILQEYEKHVRDKDRAQADKEN